MRYEYEHKDSGDRITIEADMENAPDFTIERDGRTWVRVYNFTAGKKDRKKIAREVTGERIGNKSLPRNWPFAKKHDSMGRPVFDTKGERDEAHARAAAAGELLTPRELSQPGEQSGMRVDD